MSANLVIEIFGWCLLALCVGAFLLLLLGQFLRLLDWLSKPKELKEYERAQAQIARQIEQQKTRAERLREQKATKGH